MSQHDLLTSNVPQQIKWLQVPQNIDKAQPKLDVELEFLATNCLCGKHPALTYVLCGPYIVVMCVEGGANWLKKPQNFNKDVFKKQMTIVQKSEQ